MSGFDEQKWQAYSEAGEPTNEISREEAAKGMLHAASHVWIWRLRNGNIEVLLQRRAHNKPTWPGLWDISAAGHNDYGESPLNSAAREAKEEIGLTVNKDELRLLYVFRQLLVYERETRTVENEFQFVYGFELRKEVSWHFEDGEVDDTCWVELKRLHEMVERGEVVPQGELYFNQLFVQLERMRQETHKS